MPSPSNVVAFVLAGGSGTRLLPLTEHRAKPAVPFAGSLRVIDLTLMSCVASGLPRVRVLTQYMAESLHQHLRERWRRIPGRDTVIEVLRSGPAEAGGAGAYSGTADAVAKNLQVLEDERPEAVLVLSGDHIYHADYASLAGAHLEAGADATVLTGHVPAGEASAYGVIEVSEAGLLTRFVEKPRDPSEHVHGGACSINLGVYCFRPAFLAELLEDDARDPSSSHDFGRDVLPGSIARGRVLALPVAAVTPESQPYWRDVGTVEGLFEANMDLLRSPVPFQLADPRWPPDLPFRAWLPRRRPADAWIEGRLVRGRNLISDHVRVGKAQVVNCVVSPRVQIEDGAELEECVLFPGAHVGKGARLRRAIVDDGVHVPEGCRLVQGEEGEGKSGSGPGAGVAVMLSSEWTPCDARHVTLSCAPPSRPAVPSLSASSSTGSGRRRAVPSV